jgi:hypothetical protein
MSRLLDHDRFHTEKLAWQHQVMSDARLGAFAKLLGAFVMHYLDDRKGGSWASQPFLAERLGVDVRTIRRATAELVSLGHLVVEVSRGRGKANFYRALLKESAQPSMSAEVYTDAHEIRPIRAESGELEKRTPVSAYANENRTNETVKPDSHVRPTLLEPYYPPSPQATPAFRPYPTTRRAPSDRRITSRTHLCGKTTDPSAFERRRGFADSDVRAAVVRAIGEEGARSYLDPASWRERDKTIVCPFQISAERLRAGAGAFLAELGVAIEHAPASRDSHIRLSA